MSKLVTVEKCPCGDKRCSTHPLSKGTFYAGSGFDLETAQDMALGYNLLHTYDVVGVIEDLKASLAAWMEIADPEDMRCYDQQAMTRAEAVLAEVNLLKSTRAAATTDV